MFSPDEVQKSGNMRRPRTAERRPVTSSSLVSVPASKNFSISLSSASATISISASRAAVGVGLHVGRHGLFLELAAAVRLVDERLHPDQVHDAAEGLLLADRHLHRDDRAAERAR